VSGHEVIWSEAVRLAAQIKAEPARFREVEFLWCWKCPPDRRRKVARVLAEHPAGRLILWALQPYLPISAGELPQYAAFRLIDGPGGIVTAERNMTAVEEDTEPGESVAPVRVPPEARPLPTTVGQTAVTTFAVCPKCKHGFLLVPTIRGVNILARLKPETWGRVGADGTPAD